MAIQNRRGEDLWFDPNKMLPGEMAVSTDKKTVYVAFAPGDVREFAFKDQIPIVGDITPDKLQEAVNNYLKENPVHAGATETEAKQIELNRKNIEVNDEAIKEVIEEMKNTNANVAQLHNPNLFINGHFQIWSNELDFIIFGATNEEYTTPICDKWYAKHYDTENECEIRAHQDGLYMRTLSQEPCYIYQKLDEETFNAVQRKTLTLSYSYTKDGEETVEESREIVADSDLDSFTAQTRISLESGTVLHWAKLEVGTVKTPCIPDSKDAIICKLEKQIAPQFAYMKLNTMQIIKDTHVPYNQYSVAGNAFSYDNGKIIYESDEDGYVRISATVSGSATSGRCWMRIYREREGEVETIGDAIAYGDFFSPSCTTICQCKKSDKFYVYIAEETTVRGGGVGCWFTIERLA